MLSYETMEKTSATYFKTKKNCHEQKEDKKSIVITTYKLLTSKIKRLNMKSQNRKLLIGLKRKEYIKK